MDKTTLRQEIKKRLLQMSMDDRIAKSKQICQLIIDSDMFRGASTVMTFLSLPHEMDTTPLILNAWQHGKTVAVPKVSWEQRHMIPVELNSMETGLTVEKMGLRSPTNGVPVPFEEIDLIITPGLGFDKHGNRLGRGGAFYDTFFANHKMLAARWGVGFSEQMCDEIPHDATDVPVDAVVTENEIIRCNQQ